MNEHLEIPAQMQEVLKQIEEMPLYLAEIPMSDHPKLPNYHRVLQVTRIDANCNNQFVYFQYKQVVKDKETGEVVNIPLPTPEWVVYAHTWSYFRNAKNEAVEFPLKIVEGQVEEQLEENSHDEPKENKVRVPSYKYMLWLMKYQNARFLQLIEGYARDFIRVKQMELDAI